MSYVTLCTKSLRALYPLMTPLATAGRTVDHKSCDVPYTGTGLWRVWKFTGIPEDKVKRTVAAVGTRANFTGQVERQHKWGTNGRVTDTRKGKTGLASREVRPVNWEPESVSELSSE